ncbi:hypothetical protein D3C73_1004370 [compost metagenome]
MYAADAAAPGWLTGCGAARTGHLVGRAVPLAAALLRHFRNAARLWSGPSVRRSA